MVTPDAAVTPGPLLGHRRRSLNSVRAKSVSAERPQGLCRVGVVRGGPAHEAGEQVEPDHRCLRRPAASDPRLALSRLLLGTDHRPEAALLWRHLSGLSPIDVPAESWPTGEPTCPTLTPAVLAFSERRRRRTRDRSRKGDDLRRVFELAATSDVGLPSRPSPSELAPCPGRAVGGADPPEQRSDPATGSGEGMLGKVGHGHLGKAVRWRGRNGGGLPLRPGDPGGRDRPVGSRAGWSRRCSANSDRSVRAGRPGAHLDRGPGNQRRDDRCRGRRRSGRAERVHRSR